MSIFFCRFISFALLVGIGVSASAQRPMTHIDYLEASTWQVNTLDSAFHFLEDKKPFDSLDIALLDRYTREAARVNLEEHIARSKYLSVTHNTSLDFENRLSLAKETLDFLSEDDHNLSIGEHAEAIVSLRQIVANGLRTKGDVESAIEIRYRMISFIDSIALLVEDWADDDYHAKNYYGLADLYLFDNDEISTAYADSCIVHALLGSDIVMKYRSYSMKYYTKYYGGTGEELNQIADECIKYAKETESRKQLGEAYMHKCNALVELGMPLKATEYCEKATEEYEQVSDSSFIASVLHNMGNTFQKLQDPQRSLLFYKRSLSFKKSEDVEGIFLSKETIANEYYKLGDHKAAADIYNSYVNDFMVFYKERLKSQFSEAEEKYQSREKEIKIQEQQTLINTQNRNRKLLVGISLATLLLFSSLFFGIHERNKRKRREAEAALILEQQRAQDLESLAEMKTTFFNNVSHELRTPLTLVIAPLEDAAQNVQNIDLKKDIDLALSNSKRLLTLTNEILDLSKLELTEDELVLNQFELSAFLKRVYHAFNSLAQGKNVSLEDNLGTLEELWIEADQNKLEKIITNLVGNAIKYSKAGGKVTFDVNSELLSEGTIRFSVADNGIGISADEQEKVFDRYYQSNDQKNYGGTGIGLALTKQLVSSLGGAINLESDIGQGTEFTVSIPVDMIDPVTSSDDTTKEQEAGYDEPTPIIIANEKPSILVVEDDREMSAYLSGLLNQYRVDTAPNGQEALKMITQNNYDLISSDIMMPEMDGFELRERIARMDKYSNIPYIMLTARILEEDKLKGFRLGVDDYITKPFIPSEYKARVYNLLKNKLTRLNAQMSEDSTAENQGTSITSKAKEHILQHIDQSDYTVEYLATYLNYSTRQLYRILQKEAGLSTVEFILEVRLQKAYQLIKEKKVDNVKQLRYEVGISSPSYFSKKFKERFGASAKSMMD